MQTRVLILTSWYPRRGAWLSGLFVQDQVHALAKAFDVAVLAVRLVSWRSVVREAVLPVSRVEVRDGIRVHWEERLVAARTSFPKEGQLYARMAERGFERVLRGWGKPDLIHAHVVFPGGWAGVNLKEVYGIPLVLTEHSGPFAARIHGEDMRHVARETLTQADRLIAVSPALAQQIHVFLPSARIDIVGNVIRTDFFTPGGPATADPVRRARWFFSCALLDANKGMHHLIEAMHLLEGRGVSSAELFIGGDGPVRRDLVRQAHELHLSRRCHFLGLLTRPEVRHWLRACDAFVLPSFSESFSVIVGEAMACGKPVIVTRCGGPEYLVTPETGRLVNVADPLALAEAMEDVVAGRMSFNPQVIRRSVDERFGEEAFLSNIRRIYSQLWDGGSCPTYAG